ncbi:hypothetical protein FRB99_008747 [Tulasnella sp. 403]|nr:hypothetical protein FRB99_008747 [Tulasnella sp. 403]
MADCPQEILSAVASIIFESAIPDALPSLDPVLFSSSQIPSALPSALPASGWSEPASRHTLASLCLVSRAWYVAAKPYLWRHVEVRLPRTWLAFVDEVAAIDSEEAADALVDASVQQAASVALAAKDSCDPDCANLLQLSILQQLSNVPHNSIPPELLSPPASREPSPARLRARSPGRWRFLRAVSAAMQSLDPNVYVPTPDDPHPGRHVRHLDFNHFRTIGMRRSVEEGVRSRFVTSDRLERVLKEMPQLRQFGATEYMDGALTKSVLIELLMRGAALAFLNWNGARGRGVSLIPNSPATTNEMDQDDADRRRDCRGLEAIDFCGCVSSVFVQGLIDFVREYLEDDVADDGTRTPSQVTFPTIKRLGLRGVTSIPSLVLTNFILAFTSLTHLDLSGTRCSPELLVALGDSTTVRLTSLALGRCIRLTGASITDFLVDGLPARTITQLSLYGDGTFISPLTEADLMRIVTEAPCFKSGMMEYLDLSSSPVTPDVLQAIAPQRALRSLGLSHISALPLPSIAQFLLNTAPNVEVLAIVSTSPELSLHVPWRELSLSLHSHIIRPLTTPPFQFSLTTVCVPKPPLTRLRVVELGVGTLNSLGAGGDAWAVVRSKGGRGWYVHTASGWENGVLRRDLPAGHPMRVELERLAASNGNVGSGVGWHARKMEVLHGLGMLGREDGLYGAVSFAYQG